MKTIISLITTMVFVFAFGTAFAGERQMGKSSAVGHDRDMSASFESTDVPDPYKGFAKPEIMGVRDAAAGGLRAEKIGPSSGGWDNLKTSFESTDVPDPYKGFAK